MSQGVRSWPLEHSSLVTSVNERLNVFNVLLFANAQKKDHTYTHAKLIRWGDVVQVREVNTKGECYWSQVQISVWLLLFLFAYAHFIYFFSYHLLLCGVNGALFILFKTALWMFFLLLSFKNLMKDYHSNWSSFK